MGAKKWQNETVYAVTGLAAIRNIVRGALALAGWADIARGRRAHTGPAAALALHGAP